MKSTALNTSRRFVQTPLTMWRWGLTALREGTGVVLVTLCLTATGFSLPAQSSTSSDNIQTGTFDHSRWTQILTRFVDANGLVDYQALSQKRDEFDRYIRAIETTGPMTHPHLFPTRDHQLAYYINAYNALVFKGVLSRGPESTSVWSGLISGLNFFVRMDIKIDGDNTNLKKLEDKLIRKKFRDPRIHAALNCASISCPRLPQIAFAADQLDQQLHDAMIEFVGSEANVLINRELSRVSMSEIFDWFEEDFIDFEKENGNQQPNLIDYINRFLKSNNQINRDFKINFLEYDKKINAQR